MEILTVFAIFLSFENVLLTTQAHRYAVQNGVNVVSRDYLMKTFESRSKLTCLAECNANDNCLSVVHSVEDNYCSLYRSYYNNGDVLVVLSRDGSSSLHSKICAPVLTLDETEPKCAKKDRSYASILQSLSFKYRITTFNGESFRDSHGNQEMFTMKNGYSYFVIDYVGSVVVKFNHRWKYVTKVSMQSPAFARTVGEALFVAADGRINKYDEHLNVLETFTKNGATCRGIGYDKRTKLIYVTIEAERSVDVFDLELKPLGTRFTYTNYSPYSASVHNTMLYVGTTGGMMYTRDLLTSATTRYETECAGKMMSVDFIGEYLGLLCLNGFLYLYHANMTYTDLSFKLPVAASSIIIDMKGRVAFVSSAEINIYY